MFIIDDNDRIEIKNLLLKSPGYDCFHLQYASFDALNKEVVNDREIENIYQFQS